MMVQYEYEQYEYEYEHFSDTVLLIPHNLITSL